jgi:hypothetical protein
METRLFEEFDYPKPLASPQPESWRCRIVSFSPSEGEELFFSYTLGREHGPSVVRDGIGPPRMPLVNAPWQATTSGERMRDTAWYVLDRDAQGAGVPSHEGTFRRHYPEYDIVHLLSFGDLTMNSWNTAFANTRVTGGPSLLFLQNEPLEQRTYTCLVKWKDREAAYEIADVRFDRFRYDERPDHPGVVLIGGKEVAERIEFAVFGQQFIRDGEVVRPQGIARQFPDVRHLLDLPTLNPSKGWPVLFGEPRGGDVWFGEAELLEDVNLLRAALTGPVELSRLANGLGCTKFQLGYALNKADYVRKQGADPLNPGEWRWNPDDDTLVEIHLRRARYPCAMIGIDDHGNLLSFAWQGRYNDPDGGFSLEEASARFAKHTGIRHAISCDEGLDVMQRSAAHPPEAQDLVMQGGRNRLRAVLIVAKRRA